MPPARGHPHPSPRTLLLLASALLPALAALSCSTPGGLWGKMAVDTAPAKVAHISDDAKAASAKQYFRQTLSAGNWAELPAVISALTGGYLEHPNDPELPLLLAHAHLWRISERTRDPAAAQDPLITDHLVLAEHYFQQAAILAPTDRRIPGWLGSVEMALGTVNNDQILIRRGYFRTKDSAAAYPEFNGFTFGFAMSSTGGEQFDEALGSMWRSVDRCSAGAVSPRSPAANPADPWARRADPACFNSAKAPHNWEGFWWTLGLMELKAGNTDRAKAALENAKRSPDYSTWPFRARFETDLAEAPSIAAAFAANNPAADRRMIFGSPMSCVACHQK